LLSLPSGIASAIISILMPFVLRKHGVSVDRIAEVVAVGGIPSIWYFFYSPVVDLGLQRRTWLAASTLAAALCCAGATMLSTGSLPILTVLLFLASCATGLTSTANGSLLSTMQPSVRGRASGYYQAGNLGGGAIGGGIAIWLAGVASLPVLALGVFLLIVTPVLATLLIHEERVEQSREKKASPAALFQPLFRDLRMVLTAPRTWFGLVFFLSPVGCGAMSNLISSMGPDYHAPDSEVLWVTGIASGLLSAAGAFAGGYVCDRMNRMVAYALGGGITGAFALYMMLGPRSAFTFGAGYSGYSIANGFAYAVFTALVLEVIGGKRKSSGTAYAILVSSGNVPISYMTWVDGLGYKRWGATGLTGVDAITEAGGALVLLLVAWYAKSHWHKSAELAATS
jgi:MFS transporter, PAT family, beta-lactamase induction signal transducer AmpG